MQVLFVIRNHINHYINIAFSEEDYIYCSCCVSGLSMWKQNMDKRKEKVVLAQKTVESSDSSADTDVTTAPPSTPGAPTPTQAAASNETDMQERDSEDDEQDQPAAASVSRRVSFRWLTGRSGVASYRRLPGGSSVVYMPLPGGGGGSNNQVRTTWQDCRKILKKFWKKWGKYCTASR